MDAHPTEADGNRLDAPREDLLAELGDPDAGQKTELFARQIERDVVVLEETGITTPMIHG